MKKLYLVDVSSMFFRAFFALPPLSNDQGLPTNALYGFLNMSVKLLRDIQPEYIAFCFDSKEPSFRSDIYPEYKANRDEMPADLVPQVPYVRKISEQLGVPILEKPGYEADDLIGTLTKYGRQQDLQVVIVSGDKDFAQLIDTNVCMYDTMKEVRYDREGVKTKWGVEPEQMIDYLALVGDSSDNVPGVRGIGPKGACKLLAEYKTLDGVYANIDKITAKAMKANLAAGKKNAYLSRQLCTIHCDVEHNLDLNSLQLKPIDRDKLRDLLLELGFKTFAKTLTGDDGIGVGGGRAAKELPSAEKKQDVPKEPSKRKSAPRNAGELKERSCTLQELDKTIPAYAEVWGMLTERGFYLGFENEVLLAGATGPEIGGLLARKQVGWKGFDLKSIWHYLCISEPVAVWDSMLAAYILRPGLIKDIQTVFEQVLGKPMPELITPVDLYNANREIQDELTAQLKSKGGQSVLDNIEVPLVPVLYSMERKGVRVDLGELGEQAKGLDSDVKRLESLIFEAAGGPFNISSPKQLGQILFGKLNLEPGKRTKTGFSTDSDVLEKLKDAHPIAPLLLEYRELSKLKSTYVDALPSLVKEDGRIHSTFAQAATTTGRLSSQNPNLQNIPIRTPRGRLIRKAFVPAEGQTLIAADYSQIELRILAHITSDEGLIEAFNSDLDIHQATAAEVFGVALKDVNSDMRRKAKAVNFGIAYGQGAFGLAETLGIGRQEATDIIARYFNRYKKVRQYMEDIVETAKRQGFVETVFGRRRYIDELQSKNGAIRKFGERAAINAPIQGTASDLVKMAMIKVHEDVAIPMVLQVHDELLFECPKDQLKENCERIRDDMMNVTRFVVPLKVNIANGDNWEDAHS